MTLVHDVLLYIQLNKLLGGFPVAVKLYTKLGLNNKVHKIT